MDDDTDDDLLLNPQAERILEHAIDVVAHLDSEGLAPGIAIKVLTSAICMFLQHALFGISKDEIAKDVAEVITKIAAKQQAQDDHEKNLQ